MQILNDYYAVDQFKFFSQGICRLILINLHIPSGLLEPLFDIPSKEEKQRFKQKHWLFQRWRPHEYMIQSCVLCYTCYQSANLITPRLFLFSGDPFISAESSQSVIHHRIHLWLNTLM